MVLTSEATEIIFPSRRQRREEAAFCHRSLSAAGMHPVSTQDGTRDQRLREAFQTFSLTAPSKHRCYKSVVFFELPKIVSETYFQINKFLYQRYLPALVALPSTCCRKGFLMSQRGTLSLSKEMLSEEVLRITAFLRANVTFSFSS